MSVKKTRLIGGPSDGHVHTSQMRALHLTTTTIDTDTRLVQWNKYRLNRISQDEYIYEHQG